MTRKDFFKKLGITLGAVAIAPQLLAKEEKKVRNVGKEQNEWYWNNGYPFTPEECYKSYNNGIEFWYDFSKCMRLNRNGFYSIGDKFYYHHNILYQVKHMDDLYYYCYPI